MQKEIEWLLREKYSGKPTEKFKKDVARLKRREPVDYVIGFTEFLGCKIDLSKKPLIPRQETEFWANEAIEKIMYNPVINTGQNLRILDMFSGSGCIGIAVLKNINPPAGGAHVTFADKEKRCLEQIKINCKINKINSKRYKIIKSDIFKNIKGKYDFIFANPPYVATKNISKVQKSVLLYEPKQALFAGEDGLFYIRKFLKQAKDYLNENGKIFMEFSPEQKNKIEKLLTRQKIRHFDGYKHWQFHKDQFGKWRWVEARVGLW